MWHENCSLFRFLSSQSAQNYLFCPTEFYEPQKHKIFTFWWGWVGGVVPHFQFSDVQSVFFRCTINPPQISTSASLSFGSCFYDEVVQYRLNPHGYCLDFVSDVDCNIFLPRIQNFQARKILVSSRENFMLNTRIHFIPYENEVYSGKEWSVFS